MTSMIIIYAFGILPAFIRSVKGYQCTFNLANILSNFPSYSPSTGDLAIARNNCEDFCRDQDQCWGCNVHCVDAFTEWTNCQWNAIQRCDKIVRWKGKIKGDVTHKPGILFQVKNALVDENL